MYYDDFVEIEVNSSVESDIDGDAESTVDWVPLRTRLRGTEVPRQVIKRDEGSSLSTKRL